MRLLPPKALQSREVEDSMQANDITLLSVQEVASRLGMNAWTIRSWVAEGKLASVKLGKSQRSAVRIPSSEVQRLFLENLRPATKPARKRG